MPKEKRASSHHNKADSYIHSYLWQRELGRFPRGLSKKASLSATPAALNSNPNDNNLQESPIKKIIKLFGPSSFSSLSTALAATGHQDSMTTLVNDDIVGENSSQEDGYTDDDSMLLFVSDEQEEELGSSNRLTSRPVPLGSKTGSYYESKLPNAINSPTTDIFYFSSRRLPSVLEEHEYDLSGMDKVFSAAWLSETQVVIGTKCQNLAILDVNNGKKTLVPSLNPLGIAVDNLNPTECHGIHSICINPSRTLLAVGAGKPGDNSRHFRIYVYCLPSFQHVAVLTGHDDMVFSVSWLDDYTLVSGSRDRSVKIWKLDILDQSAFVPNKDIQDYQQITIPSIMQFSPVKSEVRHQQKVRDLVIDRQTNQTFTLSADGTVKIWDSAKVKVTATVSLRYTSETVCMARDPVGRVVSVGSQSHISIIDPRVAKIVHTLESLDDGWGVRSMTIQNSLLSIGGGMGRISFYDLRAQRYIDWETPEGPSEQFLESGRGWICRDQTYRRHFQGMTVSNAVYSLSYDDSFGKLFIAGGPLQLNLKGSYAGLWK